MNITTWIQAIGGFIGNCVAIELALFAILILHGNVKFNIKVGRGILWKISKK